MASEFNRILALLRKERGITQKQAAADLGISQAQLSHYEKGIRECSLAFVVQVADYYGVSCDYLLGRSADRSGQTISVADLHLLDPADRIEVQQHRIAAQTTCYTCYLNKLHTSFSFPGVRSTARRRMLRAGTGWGSCILNFI